MTFKITSVFKNHIAFFLYFSYLNFDVNYYLKILLTHWWCKLQENNIKLSDTTIYYGICTTNDLDFLMDHMNNARYLRELDFVRLHFYERTGLYEVFLKSKAPVFQTASNIRYRRKIGFLALYRVETKVIYWDEKSIYLEHRFITIKDNFVAAIVLGKQTAVGLNMLSVINELMGKAESYRPTASPEVEDWIKSNEKSSAKLRPKILND